RPFSESEGRWLHEHRFTLEPEDARAMADALDRGDAEELAEGARPVPSQPVSRYGEARLYYLPYKGDTPVYLTLRIVDARPWSPRWGPGGLAPRGGLTGDEPFALAERLRLPGAGFGALDVVPVLDRPRRAAPAAAIEDVPPDAAGRVLNRRVIAALLV